MYVPHAKVDMRGMTLIYLINNTNHFLKKSAVAKMHAGMQHVQDHVQYSRPFYPKHVCPGPQHDKSFTLNQNCRGVNEKSLEMMKMTTPQLQLHGITTTTTAALHHTTSSSCGRGDRCNHCNQSKKKHNSNHLTVHQWIHSAIRESQQPTSPIGFLF